MISMLFFDKNCLYYKLYINKKKNKQTHIKWQYLKYIVTNFHKLKENYCVVRGLFSMFKLMCIGAKRNNAFYDFVDDDTPKKIYPIPYIQ